MTNRRLLRYALMFVACGGFPMRAHAQDAGFMDKIMTKIASVSGARCWKLASLAVQVKGRPFCQNTRGSSGYLDQGQQQRYTQLKALGKMLAMLDARHGRQERYVQHRARLEQLTRTLNVAVMDEVRVPSELLRVRSRTSDIHRVQYRLSTATVTLMGERAGISTPSLTDQERLANALTVRTFAAANAVDQQAALAVQQTAGRAAALQSAGAQGAEANRIGVEGIALLNSVQGSQAIARSQQQQLMAYQALQAERQQLLREHSVQYNRRNP